MSTLVNLFSVSCFKYLFINLTCSLIFNAHFVLLHFFQFICVPFARNNVIGPLLLNASLLLVLTTDYSD